MANRSFQQFSFGLEKMPVTLYASATIGSAGAVTLNTAQSKGIASLVLGTTGKYTITLQDPYVKLLDLGISVSNATGIPVTTAFGIVSGSTNVTTQTGGVIVFQMSAGGTATNPASGDTLYISISVGNSTAP